jgi:hypothetical protein
MKFAAVVVSCRERAELRAQTLASLAATDWDGSVDVVIDDETETQPLRRIDATWLRALQRASDERAADLVLLCEDDVAFNHHLRHNLERWSVLQGKRASDPFWGSLYNPRHPDFARCLVPPPRTDYHVVRVDGVWGGQGIVISPSLAGWIINHAPGPLAPHDRIVPWLASHMCPALFLHRPSLVEHRGHLSSTWGGTHHQAIDFDPDWRAGGSDR